MDILSLLLWLRAASLKNELYKVHDTELMSMVEV